MGFGDSLFNSNDSLTDTIIKEIPAGISVFGIMDEGIKVKNANAEFYKIIGFKDEQDFIINNGEDFQSLISDNDYERLSVRFHMSVSNDDAFEYRFQLESGRKKGAWISLIARFMNESKNTLFFQVHIKDDTKSHDMETELKNIDFNPAVNSLNGDIIFNYDVVKDSITFPMRGLLSDRENITINDFLGEKKWKDYVIEQDASRFEAEVLKIFKQPNRGEFVFRTKIHTLKEDEWIKVYYKNNATNMSVSTMVIGRLVDISKEVESESLITRKIKLDSITGFYNYNNFEQMVKEQFLKEDTKKSAFIVLKIKNIADINDNFGTMFVDTIIQNVSRKLYSLLRTTDIIGRINQDTFAVWIRNINSDILYDKAIELCNAISSEYSGDKDNLKIESCAGIAEVDGPSCFEELFAQAYSAMAYAAEQENRCVLSYRQGMPLVEITTEEFEKELYYRIENYDLELLSFAFGLLLNSRDIGSSINLLLQRIGQKFNLSSVVITSFAGDNMPLNVTNHWNAKKGVVYEGKIDSSLFEDSGPYSHVFDSKGMCIIDYRRHPEWIETFQRAGYDVRAMVACNYYIDEKLAGYVCFVDNKDSKEWTEYALGTFHEMTNIITVFLAINKRLKKDKNKIIELEELDPLTGLYNINAFKKKCEELCTNNPGEYITFLFTDINNFAYINDTYGQAAGDEVLCEFAKFIARDELHSCRVYSDYFMTVKKSKSVEGAMSQIARVNAEFETLMKKKYPLSNIRLSSGLFICKAGDVDVDTAIDNANMARKVCKRSVGELCVEYRPSFRTERSKEQQYVGGLQEALHNGDIQVYLQPKCLLDTKQLVGAEALARWVTMDGVVHSPAEFIPMFERLGQIIKVDFFIYEQVLQYMSKWKKDGKKLFPISVNFSRLHLYQKNFLMELVNLANYYDIPTDMLELEITESAITDNEEEIYPVLSEIRASGFRINMDDFGTGMSSLNMLLFAPVDVVKVDKRFLEVSIDQKNQRYIEYLGGLIQAADKEIIFEGVETEEQAKFLMECGYNRAQGYLFDKPLDVESFQKKYVY